MRLPPARTTTSSSPRALALVALLTAHGACRRPPIATGSAPPATSPVAQALGEAPCRAVGAQAAPLVVDASPELRADLEVAMRTGVPAVAFDCHSLRVLTDCSLPGSYGFFGISTKEQVIRLEDADQLRANLSFAGAGLLGGVGGSLESGHTLDVALVMVGKRVTTRRAVQRQELPAACGEATHFVRGALVGAFAVSQGERRHERAAAEIFGVGASAGAARERAARQRDGDPAACGTATPAAEGSPAQCSALLRLELVAVGEGPPSGAPRDDGPTEIAPSVCPEGLVMSEGRCAAPSEAPHACRDTDLADCEAQCTRGELESCNKLAAALAQGKGVARDDGRAVTLFARACEGGYARSCANLGRMYYKGTGVPTDNARALALFTQACDAGDPRGCSNLGVMHEHGHGVPRATPTAVGLYRRSCDGGDVRGCSNLAYMVLRGEGVTKDELAASRLFERSCQGNDAVACNNLGMLHQLGTGVAKDEARAVSLFETACTLGAGIGCANLGRALEKGVGVPVDAPRALATYQRGCELREAKACTNLGEALRKAAEGPEQAALAVARLVEGCELGDARGCAASAAAYARGEGVTADTRRAAELAAKACAAGHTPSCSAAGR